MKEARYLIRLKNHAYQPTDQGALLHQVRQLVAPVKGKAINLRISDRAIEFDLFCDPETDLGPVFAALQPVGEKLSLKRLDGPPVPAPAEAIVSEARQLFNEQRYWEVHEVLEALWHKTQGQEKQNIQGLIMTAAALVHRQKNEEPIVERMLDDALRRLQGHPPSLHGWNLDHFTSEIIPAIRQQKKFFPAV